MNTGFLKCKPLQTSCGDDRFVKSILSLIDNIENSKFLNITPFTKKDMGEIKDALGKYMDECGLCAKNGKNDYKCHEMAKQNLKRRLPFYNKNIYPWKNYDWNYGNYVYNNYGPEATGAEAGDDFGTLFKNVDAMIKLFNGFISDPIPNNKSEAGIMKGPNSEDNRDSDYPFDCNTPECQTTQVVRTGFIDKPPTTDDFLKRNLKGEFSSSYYFKAGNCPRPDLKTQSECESKGFLWSPTIMDRVTKLFKTTESENEENKEGTCSQPRYAFIDNSPKPFFNGSNAKGIIPSLANDFLQLTPDKMLAILSGQSVSNSYVLQQCPEVEIPKEEIKEGFTTMSTNHFNLAFIMIMIIIFLVIYKKYKY